MSNLHTNDIYGIIKEIIIKETMFLRHYIGEVYSTTDMMNAGRVQVLIGELGWDSSDMGIWCWPRHGNGLSVPKKNDWVEVYFINGDSSRPVYLFPASEIKENTPKSYDGLPTTHIMFEDPESEKNYMKFDSRQKTYEVKADGGSINLLDATEKFVLGDTFKTELDKHKKLIQDLQTAFTTWTPVPNDGGAALKTAAATFLADPLPDYSSILSSKIKGS